MNNKKQIAQKVIGDKKTSSRGFHKRNLSRKLSEFRRLLWVDDINEVLEEAVASECHKSVRLM